MLSYMVRRVFAGLAVMLVLGLLIPMFVALGEDDKPQSKLPADLALVPNDALWFSTFRVADLAQSKDVKRLLPLLSPNHEASLEQSFEKRFGLKLDTIERVTMVARRIQSDPVWIIHTTKAFDRRSKRGQAIPSLRRESQAHHGWLPSSGRKEAIALDQLRQPDADEVQDENRRRYDELRHRVDRGRDDRREDDGEQDGVSPPAEQTL